MGRKQGQWRKVPRYLWRDQRFRQLSDKAQNVFLWLWTGPYGNSAGIISGTAAMFAQALDRRLRDVETALEELSQAKMVDADEAAQIYVVDIFEYEPPANGSVVAHVASILADLPTTPVITRYLTKLIEFCRERGGDWEKGLADLFDTMPDRHAGKLRKTSKTHGVEHGGTQGGKHGEAHGGKHGVEHRGGHRETEREIEIPTNQPSGSGSGRARVEGVSDSPESMGQIIGRMAREDT